MARLVLAMLIAALAATPTLGQQRGKQGSWRIDPQAALQPFGWQMQTQSKVGPNTRFGLGMFGVKSERAQPPVTGREIDVPRSRRVGLGFSVRF